MTNWVLSWGVSLCTFRTLNRSANKAVSAWLWAQIALIVLPVLCLSLVGGWLLQKDKLLAQGDASARARELASTIAERSWTQLTNVTFPRLPNAWPSQTVYFAVNHDLQLTNPLPVELPSEPAWVSRLSTQTREMWAAAERAEFASENISGAVEQWGEIVNSRDLPNEATPAATFHFAMALLKNAHLAKGLELLRKLPSETNDGWLETGLRVRAIAGLQLLTHAASSNLSGTEVRSIVEQAVANPTVVTDSIIRAASTSRTVETEDLRSRWEQHQIARAVAQRWVAARADKHEESIVTLHGNDWFVLPFSQSTNELVARSVTAVIQPLLSAVVEQAAIPKHFGIQVTAHGKTIFGEPTGERFSSATVGLIETVVTLEKPELLYAQQAARTRWFTILIGGSALVALLGVVNTQRSFARERRLNELKSNFVSSVSHELRAPIASMRLMAEGLQSGRVRDSQKQNEYYDYIVQECRRLSSLIENVLDFARIEQGRKEYDFQSVAPASLVEKSIAIVQPATIERHITIKCQIAEALPEIRVDGNAICQALVNLLDNAIKHSPADSAVEIGVELRDQSIVFWVADLGQGIPAHEQERIFERFYRIGSELTRHTPGAGIGLSIVKHIVEAHRGRIEVRSAPGEGSRFTIILPTIL